MRTFHRQVLGVARILVQPTPTPAAKLGLAASRETLLGLVHALPDPEVGVDDFAIARGRKYATVLIDAVTHRRIDVLPDRKAATLAACCANIPGWRVISRDGSAAYAKAIRQVAAGGASQ
ncbi:transposase [Streptomyces sp. NPDC020747]|uniref:transposase n=1 Tax=Streptomyces sp. NPDC020747 TaxID=3365086 RepID=UPI0037B9884F